MDLQALCLLLDELRARGVTRYRDSTGLELEMGPTPKPERKMSEAEKDLLRKQQDVRALDVDWSHVGGPPPWLRDPKAFGRPERDDDEDDA